jgi:hypothetical protein
MVALSRKCRLCVRRCAVAITDPPEPLLGSILMRSVPIFCPPHLVLLHIKFNQPSRYVGDESGPFGYQHAGPPRMGA